MDIEDICTIYKIEMKNNLISLNDIAKRVLKIKIDSLLSVVDNKMIGKKYYIDLNTFKKIVNTFDSEECTNIVNMMTGIVEKNDELKVLELQYKIECEKTKQLSITRDMKLLDIKMENMEITRLRMGTCDRENEHKCISSDDDSDCGSDCQSESDDESVCSKSGSVASEKYEEIETLPIQQQNIFTNKQFKNK